MSIIKNIIKKIITYIESITHTEITILNNPRVKIKHHPLATNDGQSMARYVKLINKFCN